MAKKKIRVAIVEDSRLYQAVLKRIIEEDDQLEIAGTAGDREQALDLIRSKRPDIVTLDINLPSVNNFDLLKEIISDYGIPVIVVSSMGDAAVAAIDAGANDFIEKMENGTSLAIEQFAMLLRLKIKMQAESFSGTVTSTPKLLVKSKPEFLQSKGIGNNQIIAIGASLGGTEATLKVLKQLPLGLPPIVVVQHMPPGFTRAYARRLDKYCAGNVREAHNGELITSGDIIIAKGGEQMSVFHSPQGYRIRSLPEKAGSPPSSFCPSVDNLFVSIASEFGKKAIGVILTGLGRDGSIGLKKMHDAGAFTIGQDEATCAVYGMPAAAKHAGAIDIELPLEMIANKIISRF